MNNWKNSNLFWLEMSVTQLIWQKYHCFVPNQAYGFEQSSHIQHKNNFFVFLFSFTVVVNTHSTSSFFFLKYKMELYLKKSVWIQLLVGRQMSLFDDRQKRYVYHKISIKRKKNRFIAHIFIISDEVSTCQFHQTFLGIYCKRKFFISSFSCPFIILSHITNALCNRRDPI